MAFDVALVGPRMHGDATGTRHQTHMSGAQDARDTELPRVAQQCDLVDVDRQGGAARGLAQNSGQFSCGQRGVGSDHIQWLVTGYRRGQFWQRRHGRRGRCDGKLFFDRHSSGVKV